MLLYILGEPGSLQLVGPTLAGFQRECVANLVHVFNLLHLKYKLNIWGGLGLIESGLHFL